MPANPNFNTVHLRDEILAALAQRPELDGVDRGALGQTVLRYDHMLRDFGHILVPMAWEDRAGLVYGLVAGMVGKGYHERVVGDVLRASGVSVQEMDACRLLQKTAPAPSTQNPRRV